MMDDSRLHSVPYEDVPDYVPRTVRDAIQGQSTTLQDCIFSGEKRMILYSDAQCGKTVELKHLAAVLYQSPLYYPYLFTLDKFSPDTSIEDQIKYNQRFYTNAIPVILLDGYDELPDTEKKSVSKQILALADDHPDAVILLSCRTSYESTTVLNRFKHLYLNALSTNDTMSYLRKHCDKPDELYQEIIEKEYFAITSGPFFLKEVIRYYNKHGELPHNKSILYATYIKEICTKNGERGLWRFNTTSFETKALPLLQKTAFCITLCQEKIISFDRLQQDLGITADEAEILRDCPLLTMDGDRNCSFIHNAFKEYLAAITMSKLDKSSILKLICYPNSEKLRPAMQNTLILLIDNIPEGSLTRKQITAWLITQDSELLVRCGGELLDLQTRQQLFSDILFKHKTENLLLGYYFCDQLMEFSNTKESVSLLFDECLPGTYSRHLANILGLLSSARLELLPKAKLDKLTEIVFKIIALNINDKEHGNTFMSVLDNPAFQNRETLNRLTVLIGDSDNPYYIRQAIEIACNIGLCDTYASWILSNYKKIHDFNIPSTFINHLVFDNISDKAMMAMQDSSNLVRALESIYLDRDCEEPSKEKRGLISKLLSKLESNAFKEKSPKQLMDFLRSLDCYNVGKILISGAYRILNICGGDKLFEKQIQVCADKFVSLSNGGDRSAFLSEMNILVCMLDENRLNKLLASDILEKEKLHNLCSWFNLYPVDTELKHRIRSHFNEPEPQDERSRKQNEFNALFSTKKKNDLLEALPVADSLAGTELVVSDSQRQIINSLIRNAISSSGEYDIYHLLSVIATYEPALDDSELIKLFPYSPVQVKYLPKTFWNQDSWGVQIHSYIHFIRYIEDHVTDIRLIDNAIDDIAVSAKNYSDELIEICVRFIVNRHRKSLYYKLETLLDKIKWQGRRLTLCVEIANRIEGGFSMIVDYTDSFEPEDKLIFYENALFPADKSILNSQEQIMAVQKTEKILLASSDNDQKEKAISILVRTGHPTALDYALEHLEDHKEWIKSEYFPSLGKYGYESLDKLERLFSLACDIPYHPHFRFNSFDSTLEALERIGSTTILARDRVVDLMRMKAATTTHNELFLYARETLDKYYENCNPVPSLKEAGELYGRYIISH